MFEYNQKKNPENKCYGIFKWYLQESNQGHKDFQSFALPTELRYLCKAVANINPFLVFARQNAEKNKYFLDFRVVKIYLFYNQYNTYNLPYNNFSFCNFTAFKL